MKLSSKISYNWWDGRQAESFFSSVYKTGDDSLEGHLDNQLLRLNERTKRECDIIETVLGLSSEARILDCPCGYGRHSLELAGRGYQATGVDLCPAFLESAEESLKRSSADIKGECRFVSGDMRNLPEDLKGFDACVNMFFSFGFFDEDENMKVLKGFYKALAPGGKLLIHTDVNPNRIKTENYKDRSKRTLKNSSRLIIDERYNPENKRLEGSWTVESREGTETGEYSVRIYGHQELRDMLEKAGFKNARVIFAGEGVSDDPDAQEVMYVAEK